VGDPQQTARRIRAGVVKIVFIGQKGVPATFGGVEYHVDELSRSLVSAGNEVLAYVRTWYTPRGTQAASGVRLCHVPTLRTKHLDASVHSFLCSLHALFQHADIIHYHGIGPAVFSVIPKLVGKKVIATVHRLDWQTEKWGRVAKFLLRVGEWASVSVPDKTIVVSRDLQRYFRARYGRETDHVPHGISLPQVRPPDIIRQRHGLQGKDYVLFMGRLVPEKRVDWLIRSFCELVLADSRFRGMRLVIAGGSSSTDKYVEALGGLSAGCPGIVYTGYVTGVEKEELLSNALVLALPSYLEGFPIVLLEAKSYGVCCLVSDIPPHREAVRSGVDGVLFDARDRSDLTGKLKWLLSDSARAESLGLRAREEMRQRLSWGEVVGRTLAVYRTVLRGYAPR
jgi:glycosyltransferase involved in cell wall biosynthesis